MNIKKLFASVLAFVLACNFAMVSAAEPTKQNNQPVASPTPVVMNKPVKKQDDRYEVVGGYVKLQDVGFSQPKYTGPATVNRLGLKTAGELGLTGKLVYNEYEHSARTVYLSASAQVYYDTASMEPLYLAGCFDNGKPFANRLKLVQQQTPVVLVPQPTPVAVIKPPSSEVQYQKPAIVQKKNDTGYEVEFKEAKGKVVIIPAVRLLPQVGVVDIPQPNVRANGQPLAMSPRLAPADACEPE